MIYFYMQCVKVSIPWGETVVRRCRNDDCTRTDRQTQTIPMESKSFYKVRATSLGYKILQVYSLIWLRISDTLFSKDPKSFFKSAKKILQDVESLLLKIIAPHTILHKVHHFHASKTRIDKARQAAFFGLRAQLLCKYERKLPVWKKSVSDNIVISFSTR